MIRPMERMIPAGPINGNHLAILALFLIGLPAVSVFNSTERIPSEQDESVCFLQYQVHWGRSFVSPYRKNAFVKAASLTQRRLLFFHLVEKPSRYLNFVRTRELRTQISNRTENVLRAITEHVELHLILSLCEVITRNSQLP